MKRVGRFTDRISRRRRLQIVRNVVIELSAKSKDHHCKMKDVALRMGLSPSTYVMNLLSELLDSGIIEGGTHVNSRRNVVYLWWCDDGKDCNSYCPSDGNNITRCPIDGQSCTFPYGK